MFFACGQSPKAPISTPLLPSTGSTAQGTSVSATAGASVPSTKAPGAAAMSTTPPASSAASGAAGAQGTTPSSSVAPTSSAGNESQAMPSAGTSGAAGAAMIAAAGSSGADKAAAPSAPKPSAGCQGGNAKPGDVTQQFNGRDYVLYIPTGYDGHTPLPLVVDLHGAYSSGSGQERLSGLRQLADPATFIYLAPNGTPPSGGTGGTSFVWDGVQDTDRSYVRSLVMNVEGAACIDQTRVYATGCSNGGALDFLLACRDADMFAAAAPMCAGAFIDLENDCKPSRPVPLMFVIGENDSSACWEGDYAPVILPPIMTPCARKVQKVLSAKYMCKGQPQSTHNGTCETVDQCDDGAKVVICKTNTSHVVYMATNLNVAKDAWDFLRQFTMP